MADALPPLATEVLRCAPAGRGTLYLVRAPGRVNLLGEHTDYNGLPVLPLAIDRAIYVAARTTGDGWLRARNLETRFPECEFAIAPAIAPSPAGEWTNYLKAAAQALAREPAVAPAADASDGDGVTLMVGSDLPADAGLSSSAALVVATALALLARRDAPPDRVPLAELLARAEHYVGTLSGGMDQATILLAEHGKALVIEFFPLRAAPVPFPASHAIVVCDSLVRADKSGGAQAAYNRRVVECRLATRVMAAALDADLARLGDARQARPGMSLTELVTALASRIPDRPLSLREIASAAGTDPEALAPLLADAGGRPLDLGAREGFKPLARARHVLTETGRVERAVTALAAGDVSLLGALMAASHASCRDDFDISVPALDELVALAGRSGATGARVTGAGFGGSTVNLVPLAALADFLARVDAGFYRKRLAPSRDPAAHRLVLAPSQGATITRIE